MNKYKAIAIRMGARPVGGMDVTPVAGEQIDAVELQLGCSFPADYRNFVKHFGGYTFSHPLFPVIVDRGTKQEESIFMFYSVSADKPTVADRYEDARANIDAVPEECYPGLSVVRASGQTEETTWPPELLPIGCDMGGNQICLALFGLRPGAVFQWVNAPGEDEQNVYLIAESFDEFMHLLRPSDE